MSLIQKLRGQDAFDSLRGESESRDKRFELGKFKVGRGTPLEAVLRKFDKLISQKWTHAQHAKGGFVERFYAKGLKELPRTLREDISPEVVEQFSVALKDFEGDEYFIDKQRGLYLSALIEASPAQDFRVHTLHLEKPLDHAGYCNTKNVVINGNVQNIGSGMSAGTVLLRGNAKTVARIGMGGKDMTGGMIEIQGDVGSEESESPWGSVCPRNGTVRIHGDVYDGIYTFGEREMRIYVHGNVYGHIDLHGGHCRGEVHLDGDYEKIILKGDRAGYQPYFGGFKITQKGKTLVHGYEMNVPEAKIEWAR